MAKYSDIKGFTVQTLSSDPAASVADTGSWASVASLNAANREGGGSGTSTSAINVGGYPYPMTSEQWNGSAWTEVADVATARYDSNAGGAPGSGTSAIMTGGYGTAYSAGTEEWTAADFEIKTVTTS